MANAFAETKNLFQSYTGYVKPLTYDEWLAVADDAKAAVLYVQFYDEITLAWYKVRSLYTPEERGVEEMCHYLIKNVPVIAKDPKRFNSRYLYRVAYNCLYCICHDIKVDKERFALERSNIVQVGDDEVDLFDAYAQSGTIEHTLATEAFWRVVESIGKTDEEVEEVWMVVNSLLGADCPVAILNENGRVARRIPKDRQEQIVDQLRVRLGNHLRKVNA